MINSKLDKILKALSPDVFTEEIPWKKETKDKPVKKSKEGLGKIKAVIKKATAKKK